MTPSELLAQLLLRGGAIVRARDCTNEEVEAAMVDKRFASDESGNAFILRPERFTASAFHMPS